MERKRSVVAGCGSYLPEKVMTNAQLSNIVATTDEWIDPVDGSAAEA